MSGTFQLVFNGETTPVINAAATAEELRSALESLNGITTTAVSRDLSVSEVGGDTGAGDVDLTFGGQSAQCSRGGCECLTKPLQRMKRNGVFMCVGRRVTQSYHTLTGDFLVGDSGDRPSTSVVARYAFLVLLSHHNGRWFRNNRTPHQPVETPRFFLLIKSNTLQQ